MGKPLTQQRRGKGSPTFRAHSTNFFAKVRYPARTPSFAEENKRGQILRFVDDPSKSTLLVEVYTQDDKIEYHLAAEGQAVGDNVYFGGKAEPKAGNITTLGNVPDGTPVFNLELTPGDGGKISRAAGSSCYVVAHDEETGVVQVRLPSKRLLTLNPMCRATVGIACGGGRLEKPLKKASGMWHIAKARGLYYPKVRGAAMAAYDHPHGGKSLGKSNTVKRSTPPGRKVGLVAARRSGRRKG